MRSRRRLTAALVALGTGLAGLLGAAVLSAPPAAAAAPADAIMLSTSPTGPWAQNIAAPQFDGAPRLWVPGDSSHGTIYIATRACTVATGTAQMFFDAHGDQAATDLQEDFVFTEYIDGQGPAPSGSTFAIRGNQVHRFDLTATLPLGDRVNVAGNDTQHESVVGLQLVVTLTCADGDEITYTTPLGPAQPGSSWWVDHAGSGKATAAPPITPEPLEPSVSPSPSGGGWSAGGSAGPTGEGAPARVHRGTSWGWLPRTGIEAARTLLAALVLALSGTMLVLMVRDRRAGGSDA